MHLRGRWWLILTFITPGLVLYTVFVQIGRAHV